MIWLQQLFIEAIAVQREIYTAFGDRIDLFAESGDWRQLAVFLPMGIVFGAVHALTPGHSKMVLATYLAGTPAAWRQGLGTAMLLSAIHVSMSVIIVVLSLPLVSVALGSAGRAPLLEDISRGLLGLIGLWLIVFALRPTPDHPHPTRRNAAFAVTAGLIPCPLTLFVMLFAATRGVPQAGIAFAAVMMVGVALTLGAVAMAALCAHRSLERVLTHHPHALARTAAALQVLTGIVLVIIAINALTTP